jgi:phosphodiesterase/alkaline phosphatase D-like protein
LQPARAYWYRFTALGQRSTTGRTRTAPAPDSVVRQLDFAIASCQRYDVGHYAAWGHAALEELDLLVFLGDYIYEYPTARNAVRPHQGGQVVLLDDYRKRYAQYKSDPALQAAHAACPWLVVWDDHEVDNDYAGLQGQRLQAAFAAQRAAAYQAWWEHMPVPKAWRPLDGTLRIYGSVDWGRLARFHLLDDRQYRDPQACPREGRGGSHTLPLADCAALADPKRTLLGTQQEQWLAGNWSLQRPWNLLAQQTLMSRFSWSDPGSSQTPGGTFWTDGWDGYAPARQRLLDVVARQQVPGVVVLGGDVHAHYVADLKADFNDARAPVCATEFCGTSISSLGLPQDRIEAARAICLSTGIAADMARHAGTEEARRSWKAREDLLTPIAKAWSTDIGVDVASQGVQIHGGMGFVEETGAAQYYRDARIAPIYEGTNGIQAMDLVGRKLSQDGGASAKALIAEMKATLRDLGGLYTGKPVERFAAAIEAAQDATLWLLDRKADPDGAADVLAAADSYLKLMGDVIGGWMLARGALAAEARLAAGDGDPAWLEGKIALYEVYAANVLGHCSSRLAAVGQGGALLQRMTREALGA